MKLFPSKSFCRQSRDRCGFTLAEMLVASTIFLVIIVAAMISVQLYGLRVYNLATTKVKATASARETINDIRDRVRTAQAVGVGIYTNGNFTPIATGLNVIGNALKITPNTNSPGFVVFFQDPDNTNISLASNGVVINVEANFVTNYYCFQAEDYQQNVLTNINQNNPVISVELMFSQLAFAANRSGVAGDAYDYYRLRTRMTMRAKI
jgi:prepilin-type N-terminal cleavage/methylation domain-containing protein